MLRVGLPMSTAVMSHVQRLPDFVLRIWRSAYLVRRTFHGWWRIDVL